MRTSTATHSACTHSACSSATCKVQLIPRTSTAMGIIRSMAALDQRNFPGTLYKVLVVNTPLIFQAAFALVSYMLDEETAAKVHVVGYPLEDDDALDVLLQDIDADVLPAFLGGTGSHARGGLPLHWRLRRGQMALDEEMLVEIASGTVVTAKVRFGGAGDEGVDWSSLALVIRSLSFNVNVEVCLVTQIDDMDVPVIALPMNLVECQDNVVSLPLGGGGDGEKVVGVRLRFDHAAMWRTRTVFFEVPGVLAENWSVVVD